MGKYTVHLVGESFGNRQKNIAHATEGQKVLFVRQPKNPHSRAGTATLVTLPDGKELGYIGEKNSGWISNIIDSGRPIDGKIKAITGGGNKRHFRGVILEVRTGPEAKDFHRKSPIILKGIKDILNLTLKNGWVLARILMALALIIYLLKS